MSSERLGQGSGKMSSAHGVVTKGVTKGMRHASGRVGAGKSGFKSGNYKQGPCNIGGSGYTNDGSHYGKMRKGY